MMIKEYRKNQGNPKIMVLMVQTYAAFANETSSINECTLHL